MRTVGVGLRIGNGWTRYADFDPFVAGNVWFNARLLKSFGVLSQLRFKGQRPAFSNDDDKYRSFDPVRIRVQEWVTLWTVETGLSRSF
ncbi:MAG: hypothetical protein KC502_23420 [Myxococcales bacterium]|nr:hypothetical protein [Myxococcales bacterium]